MGCRGSICRDPLTFLRLPLHTTARPWLDHYHQHTTNAQAFPSIAQYSMLEYGFLALRTPRPTVTKTRLHRIVRSPISSPAPPAPTEGFLTVCCTTQGYLCWTEDAPSSTESHCIIVTGDFNLILVGDICTVGKKGGVAWWKRRAILSGVSCLRFLKRYSSVSCQIGRHLAMLCVIFSPFQAVRQMIRICKRASLETPPRAHLNHRNSSELKSHFK